MALRKGFLRAQPIIDPSWLGAGVALGTAFSFGLYGLFYYLREVIRVLTAQFGSVRLLELSPRENFYYNLFYGSIAAIAGLYLIVKFVVENSINRRNKKAKRRQRYILNEQSFFGWTFLNAFVRWTSLAGIWYLTLAFQFEIDFLREYGWVLVLIPTVFFLNLWPSIVRAMGGKGYRWFGYAFLYVSALSLLYANLNFYDYQSANRQLQSQNIEVAYDLRVPRSQSGEWLKRRSLIVNAYVVNDSLANCPPLIFWDRNKTRIKKDELADYVAQERQKFFGFERERMVINLHADRNVSLKFINQIKALLRQTHVSSIHYSTAVKHSKYPTYYAPFQHWGITQELLPRYYPQLVAFLDSAEQLDPSKYALRVPASPMYRIRDVEQSNRLSVRVTANALYLNQGEVSFEQLQSVLYRFVQKYAPRYVIRYDPDEAISYGRYIAYLDLIHTVIDRHRNELSYQLYGEPVNPYPWAVPKDTIIRTYPKSIVEWTPEEKRLRRLMNKM